MTDRSLSERSFGPPGESDVPALARLIALAFAGPPAAAEAWVKECGLAEMRVVRERGGGPIGAVAGGGPATDLARSCLARVPMGQYFGGRSVPMVGIAGVAVAPEDRGRGLALDMMQRAMRELGEAGVPLSGLYASTQTLYRQVGFEQGGHCFRVRLPLGELAVRDRAMAVRALTDADEPAVRSCYARFAACFDGMLERGPYVWKRVRKWRETLYQGWGVFSEGRVGDDLNGGLRGYLFIAQDRKVESGRFDLLVSDLAFDHSAAGRRLLGLLADFATIGDDGVLAQAGPIHPLLALLPTQKYSVDRREYWMTRITHVRNALEARGYPAGVSARLGLDIEDPLINGNCGPITLTIEGGRGRVAAGAPSHGRPIRLNVRALAPLYTGLWSPRQAMLAGLLEGDDDQLSSAAAVLPAGSPWMADFF